MPKRTNSWIFKKGTAYVTFGEMKKKGIHPRNIARMVKSGDLLAIKRGLYKNPKIDQGANQGLLDLSVAEPRGVICLLSALSYYELTTFNPSVISMALPRDVRFPKILYPPVEFYHLSEEQFKAGIEEVNLKGIALRIYSREKTICDCFRYRNKIGLDAAKEGLAEYLKLKSRNIEKLLQLAQICRVRPLVETWLKAMV